MTTNFFYQLHVVVLRNARAGDITDGLLLRRVLIFYTDWLLLRPNLLHLMFGNGDEEIEMAPFRDFRFFASWNDSLWPDATVPVDGFQIARLMTM